MMSSRHGGAASGTRTRDLFVTNEMLYRLSYCGLVHCDDLQCGCKGSTIFLISQTLIYNLFAVGYLDLGFIQQQFGQRWAGDHRRNLGHNRGAR